MYLVRCLRRSFETANSFVSSWCRQCISARRQKPRRRLLRHISANPLQLKTALQTRGGKTNSKKEAHLEVGSKLASGAFSCAPISPSLKRPVADLQPATDKVGSLQALHASITLPCAAPLDAMHEACLLCGASCTPHVYQLASAYHLAA